MTSGRVAPASGVARALALSCHPLPTDRRHRDQRRTGCPGRVVVRPRRAAGRRGVRRSAVHRLVQRRHRRRPGPGQRPRRQTGCPRRCLAPGGRHRGRCRAAGRATVLSLALGWQPGLASLTVVACGWLYNLGLKATAFSFVPYAIAFGMLPAVATLALPDPTWPAPWAMVAGALFGVSAHLANVLPDLDDDIDTGVRGLPHRIGARATAVACPVLLGAASLVILWGTSGGSGTGAGWRWVAAVALVGVDRGRRRRRACGTRRAGRCSSS